nr:hypothetical protein [Tanacetum cinerariifolium]
MGTHDDEAGSSRSKCSKNMKPWKRLRKSGSDEKIFTSVAWIRAFNINEPIYVELCHEFYSTYEFDEVCADDELQTKKIIKFRLGGRAHNLPFLEFARRLGLYQAVELEEEGFNVYFKGGLRSDEHFNAQDYWLGISREENLGLSQCQDAVRSLSALIYYRDLDTITLRDLIDCDGKLIPEDPQPGVPRVGIPRPPRASMKDLYDRIGRIEICQEAIEGMEYRQSYHWDRYQGVFKYMAGVYSVPLQGAYNAPGTVNVEETASNVMVAIDGAEFDWSYMADDEVPTNMALMAFSDSKPEFEGYGPKTSKSVSENISNKVKESPYAPLVKELVSDDKLEK